MQCPQCGSQDVIPITYGAPPVSGPKLTQAIQEKTIILGGCAICQEETPKFCCRRCDHRFDPPEKAAPSLWQRLTGKK